MGEVTEKAPAIYQAIAGVMKDIAAVGKEKEFKSKYGGYKFRGIDDVMNALHPAMVKNKVFVVPVIMEQTREAKVSQSGNSMVVSICKIRYGFYAEDGSCVSAVVIGEGMDTGDKATNKAMSIAFKYACFQVFCIPTEEMADPDGERPEQEEAGKSPAKEGAKTAAKQRAKTAPQAEGEQAAGKITEAMLNTIRAEQERTGVADQAILGRKSVSAKKIEDMTVEEFKAVMEIFKKTPGLKREEANE